MSAAALAYDAIAADYDAQVRGDDWMRKRLHAHYGRTFRAGDHVLDVGCGTGIDALVLAQRGVHVLGIDISAEMVAHLRAKVDKAGLGDNVTARVLGIERLGELRGEPFDGLISAFAGLSALDDLTQFAVDAASIVRPGGHLVLHMLNRFSLWEWLGYMARRNWPAARQVGRVRSREFIIGGRPVRHALYFADEAYRRFFAGRFVLHDAYGLGALRPPHTVRRIPARVVDRLEWLDTRTGGWPLLKDAGRFFVLDLERLSS